MNRAILSLVFIPFIAADVFADLKDPAANIIADSRNQIIKLSEAGISPQTLKMRKDDSIVFLFNDTADALITMEIDYGKKETHCASQSLQIGEDGVIRSVRPVAPKDFASMCFHEPGTYPYKIYGLTSRAVSEGSIVVE